MTIVYVLEVNLQHAVAVMAQRTVYIFFGTDRIEQAAKCLTKNHVKYCSEQEQDILTSKNVRKCPRIYSIVFF